jgi:hypothetical protein
MKGFVGETQKLFGELLRYARAAIVISSISSSWRIQQFGGQAGRNRKVTARGRMRTDLYAVAAWL